jgi:methyl-accepting chemotaxis protein
MFRKTNLTAKIAGSIATILLVTSTVGFFITRTRINGQAEDAFVDKLRKTDGMASNLRNYFSTNVDAYVPNHQFKETKQIPVVVAWNVAREYAESQGMKFSTPSMQPRNPQHAPDDFEREALVAFSTNAGMKEYFRRITLDGRTVMRYAQPVRLTSDCLFCHGDPAGTKDPFGYSKEGMKAGDLRGAFVVTAAYDSLEQTLRANSQALLLVSAGILLAGVGVIFFIVRRWIVAPVSAAAQLATQIANNNLIAEDIEVHSQDEIGQAVMALNQMKSNLHALITSIADHSHHVATASEELSATSQQISANSEETSAQANVVSQAAQQVSQNLQTLSTGAEEMTSTIQSIASNAHEAATIASNAVQTAQAANATVGKLGDSSAEIGAVIKVITSIAQQTNLLALNATIEAARAGEAGKGFAVVANEVKELAKQTAKATEDISRKITAIQSDTKGAVEAIASIGAVINQVNDISGTIATAVEEQSATTNEMTRNVSDAAKGSDEITHNIAGVADAAHGTSSSAQQSQKAANELADMAAQLRKLVAQFRIHATAESRAEASAKPPHSKAMAAHV